MTADRATVMARACSDELGVDDVTVVGRATVGLSQETWFVELGGASRERVVVRLPTAGSGTRGIAVQRRALALADKAGVPVPSLVAWSETTENAFGVPYLVMAHIDGKAPWSWSAIQDPQQRQDLAEEAVTILAKLHAIDVAACQPEELPRSLPSGDSLAAGELETYRRRLSRLPGPVPAQMELAMRWLEARVPDQSRPMVFLHNDFRMGNFLIADGRITAVLDWELAGFGDPAGDVTWCYLTVWDPVELDIERVNAAYEKASGTVLSVEVLRFYSVLGYLRNAYYALSGWAAFSSGGMSDLRMAALRYELPVRLDRLMKAIAGEVIV